MVDSLSYLHFDHVGGTAQIPRADLLVSDLDLVIETMRAIVPFAAENAVS